MFRTKAKPKVRVAQEEVVVELDDRLNNIMQVVLYERHKQEPDLILEIHDSRTPEVASQLYLDAYSAQELLDALLYYLSGDTVGTGRY